MTKIQLLGSVLLTAAMTACVSSPEVHTVAQPAANPAMHASMTTVRGAALRQNMRELWADHVVWTRSYIVAATSDHPSATAALNRLMTNQEDLGNAIVPFYGADAGNKLTALLKDHIRIAGDVVAAAKANDSMKLDAANRRWHDNAADIATFLSGANPNWPRSDLLAMLKEHLALTTQEATARLQGKWDEDRMTFDRIFDQAMMMADALADGIAKQYPDRVN